MIETFSVENFKCFKNKKELNISNLTLLSGLNSSGKSSIYQTLLLLQQSETSLVEVDDSLLPYLRLNGSTLQLGNPEEIINDLTREHITFEIDTKEEIKIELAYKLSVDRNFKLEDESKNKPIFILDRSRVISEDFYYHFEMKSGGYYIKSFKSLTFSDNTFEDHLFKYIQNKAKEFGVEVPRDDYLSSTVEFDEIENVRFYKIFLSEFEINLAYAKNCLDTKYRDYFNIEEFCQYLLDQKYEDDIFTLQVGALNKIARTFNLSRNIVFIPPFRGYPKRVYVEIDDPNPLAILDDNLTSYVQYKIDQDGPKYGTLKEAITYWIPLIIGNDNSFKVNSLFKGLVSGTLFKINERYIAINNVGFGISQILPMIFRILLAPHDSLCIIDEPEVHLHPALQSRLADFFVVMSQLDKKLIIETHSEYIINKLVYYKLMNNEVSIDLYWILKTEIESEIKQIEYDSLGFVINKPAGFLDENENLLVLLNNERFKKI